MLQTQKARWTVCTLMEIVLVIWTMQKMLSLLLRTKQTIEYDVITPKMRGGFVILPLHHASMLRNIYRNILQLPIHLG